MESSGQSIRGPPPLEGRPVGYPMNPGFPSLGGIPHGTMASGRGPVPVYPPEQPAMQRAHPTHPDVPREANVLFGRAERPPYPSEQAAVQRANLGQPGLPSQFNLELQRANLLQPGLPAQFSLELQRANLGQPGLPSQFDLELQRANLGQPGLPSQFNLELRAPGTPGPQVAPSGRQQAPQLRRPLPHGTRPPGIIPEQVHQVSWCTESGTAIHSLHVCKAFKSHITSVVHFLS